MHASRKYFFEGKKIGYYEIIFVYILILRLTFFWFQTDATMTELEIDMNMRIGEWSIIQESGRELVPCYGPGYTGLVNLGNSCYLNSVMQVMFSLPEFKTRWVALSLSPPFLFSLLSVDNLFIHLFSHI